MGVSPRPAYDAVVTILFVNCARAISTHLLPSSRCVITQFNSGRRVEPLAAALFAGTAEPVSQPSRSTMRRTGRLLTPSMPLASSARPAPPTAAVVAHPGDDVAERHDAVLCGVRFVEHALLPAALTGDAQEPRRKRGEGFVESLSAGQVVVAVGSPVAAGDAGHWACPPHSARSSQCASRRPPRRRAPLPAPPRAAASPACGWSW